MGEEAGTEWTLGLDLGQAADFTALAALERSWRPAPAPGDPGKRVTHYALRYLRRWPLKTAYPDIVADVAALVKTPPLDWPKLAVDQTGVGRAVVDMFRKAQPAAAL